MSNKHNPTKTTLPEHHNDPSWNNFCLLDHLSGQIQKSLIILAVAHNLPTHTKNNSTSHIFEGETFFTFILYQYYTVHK